MGIAAIIPARFESTRFPGKPLATIAGRPMVERVYDRVSQARLLDAVWVATDDERIAEVVRGFSGRVVMTSKDACSGTDRIAEALSKVDADIVINVQGDEPLIEPRDIDQLARALANDPDLNVATLAYPLGSQSELQDPNIVKVVRDLRGNALYFSRAPIPHRQGSDDHAALKHIGMYAYRSELVRRFTGWAPTPCESAERLEQLRLLEHGVAIKVLDALADTLSVDVPADVALVEKRLQQMAQAS